MFALTTFAVLLVLYLLPIFAAVRGGIGGRAQLFIVVTLFVSALSMFPVIVVLLSVPASVFSITAAGAGAILPTALWFAAFAAGCLCPGRNRMPANA